jgi:hypothetical protein
MKVTYGRQIFGQIFRVDVADSVLGAAMPEPVRPAVTEVVFVPWMHDGGCNRHPVTRSARRIRVGAKGLYAGELRDRAEWVGGRPTIDVTLSPSYHWGLMVQSGRRAGSATPVHPDSLLTPEQALGLYEILPASHQEKSSPEARAAIEPVLQWADANPDLAARYPASGLIHGALMWAADASFRNIRSSLGGTYRFRLTLPSGESLELFTRTTDRPVGRVFPPLESLTDTLVIRPRTYFRATGYSLLALSATTRDGLPSRRSPSREDSLRQGHMHVLGDSANVGPDANSWRGAPDMIDVAIRLTTDTSFAAKLAAVRSRMPQLAATGYATTGTFVRHRAGQVRFEWVLRDSAEILLTVRGERIAGDLLANP